jgi:hypothetical protein
MTENYPTGTTPPPAGGWPETEQDTAQLVKDQASDLANSGVRAGKHVGDVAREQASGVAAEAGRQGRNLLEQAQGQLHEQAAEGQHRIAQRLLSQRRTPLHGRELQPRHGGRRDPAGSITGP